jgi:hypothetical protein
MFTIPDLEALQQRHPEARFCIHDGYGPTWGSPQDPTPVTLETACRLLNLLSWKTPEADLRKQLEEEPAAIAYTKPRSKLYKLTHGNCFLAFIRPEFCTYRDGHGGHPIPPPECATPLDLAIPEKPAWYVETKFHIACILLALVAILVDTVLPYFEGRSNHWWGIGFLAFLLSHVLSIFCAFFLLGSFVRSLFTKRHRLAKAAMLLLGPPLLYASFTLSPPGLALFHLGFTQWARTIVTLDEWREIARYTHEHKMPEAEPLSSESLYQKELASATAFGKLGYAPRIYVTPDYTEIYWGGALGGHRYVIIFARKGGEIPDEPYRSTFIAEDIATYTTD